MTKAEIKGLKELERKLKKLEANIQDKIIDQSLEESGELLREEAFRRTPVKGGTSEDGNYISDSKLNKSGQPGVVRKSLRAELKKGRGEVTVRVGTNSIIATPLEFGTSREAAKPFLRPAFDANKKKILDKFADDVRKGIDREVRQMYSTGREE